MTEPRRTIRRAAHELYPAAEEYETRPLAVEVPHLYARALALETTGTDWFERTGIDAPPEDRARGYARIENLVHAKRIALLADALLQGLTGDEAWEWADQRGWEESGEWIWERAVAYGIDPYIIKPYPVIEDLDHHTHYGPPDKHGFRSTTPAAGYEHDCPECTEPFPEGQVPHIEKLYTGAEHVGWLVDNTRDRQLARRLVTQEIGDDPAQLALLESAVVADSARWAYRPSAGESTLTLTLVHALDENDNEGTFEAVRFTAKPKKEPRA